VGKYNEFENLRVAGVRHADLRGYSYDRTDVTARGLANFYAQVLGTVFTQESKPYEVEIVVAEVGASAEEDQIYRLTYDGSVADENGFAVMGGSAETITETVRAGYRAGLGLAAAVQLAVRSLATDGGPNTPPRELGSAALEVAVLDRTRILPRKFRRIKGDWLTQLLTDGIVPPDPGPEAPPAAPPAEVPETELGQPEG
jgi:proteasome alpha subunit